jgi:hypothetical protein
MYDFMCMLGVAAVCGTLAAIGEGVLIWRKRSKKWRDTILPPQNNWYARDVRAMSSNPKEQEPGWRHFPPQVQSAGWSRARSMRHPRLQRSGRSRGWL